MESLKELKIKREKLCENIAENLPAVRVIDKQIKELKKLELLNFVNAKYEKIREVAKQVFEAEKPNIDVTCSDGSFHKSKIKAYPKLAALQYARAVKTTDNLILELEMNGDRFRMYKTTYQNGRTEEHTPIESFEDFFAPQLNTCKRNNAVRV